MPKLPEQLSLLDAEVDIAPSTASIIASRPVVDLRNSQVMAYEYMACDHYSFLPSPNNLSVTDLQYILETSKLLYLPEILLSVRLSAWRMARRSAVSRAARRLSAISASR